MRRKGLYRALRRFDQSTLCYFPRLRRALLAGRDPGDQVKLGACKLGWELGYRTLAQSASEGGRETGCPSLAIRASVPSNSSLLIIDLLHWVEIFGIVLPNRGRRRCRLPSPPAPCRWNDD